LWAADLQNPVFFLCTYFQEDEKSDGKQNIGLSPGSDDQKWAGPEEQSQGQRPSPKPLITAELNRLFKARRRAVSILSSAPLARGTPELPINCAMSCKKINSYNPPYNRPS
jgi:hypothetical protein